jgi:hypothetical protein
MRRLSEVILMFGATALMHIASPSIARAEGDPQIARSQRVHSLGQVPAPIWHKAGLLNYISTRCPLSVPPA